jgi:hypothetical protein
VIETTDENYPQIVGDIQAYDVFEKEEPAYDQRKKAGPHSTKTSPHNRKNTKTTTKITYGSDEIIERTGGAPLGDATEKKQE